MLLKQLLKYLPISLDGPWNCILANVSIKVNVFIRKNICYVYNYVQKLWKTVSSEINIYFLCACFFKMLETITHYKISRKKLTTTTTKYFQFCIDYESNKYMMRILLLKKSRRAHHNGCNLKLVLYYSILS